MKVYMQLNELLCKIEYTGVIERADSEVECVSSRVNEICEGGVFVLVKGVSFDTSALYEKIIQRAPLCVVCDEDSGFSGFSNTVRVKSARRALALLLSRFYEIDYDKIDFIGVTGTNGKTTTATLIFEIMKYAGKRVGFIGTGKIIYMNEAWNEKYYSMTTPDPELLYKSIRNMQDSGCEVIVMEVSSHAIALEKVAPIPFKYALFTNLSAEHLDFHKDMDDYFGTKLRLFEKSQFGIFNRDDPYSAKAMAESRSKCTVLDVGVINSASAVAISISQNGFEGCTYFYKDAKRIFKVKLSLVGYHNVYNSLMALKCAIDYGISACTAKEALAAVKRVDGRFEIINDGISVIIDYAHTPEAFENVLKTVNSLKNTRQNIITVFGCGGNRDREKRPVMAKIAEKYSSLVIVTEDNSRSESVSEIFSDIVEGFENPCKRKIITSRTEAIRHAIAEADEGDIVLILGKGHERYSIGADGYRDYDEREAVGAALEKRKAIYENKTEQPD